MLLGFRTRWETGRTFGFGGNDVFGGAAAERRIRIFWIDFGEVEEGSAELGMELLTHVSHLESYEDKSETDNGVHKDDVVTV